MEAPRTMWGKYGISNVNDQDILTKANDGPKDHESGEHLPSN